MPAGTRLITAQGFPPGTDINKLETNLHATTPTNMAATAPRDSAHTVANDYAVRSVAAEQVVTEPIRQIAVTPYKTITSTATSYIHELPKLIPRSNTELYFDNGV